MTAPRSRLNASPCVRRASRRVLSRLTSWAVRAGAGPQFRATAKIRHAATRTIVVAHARWVM
jgi:hypothetical protein